MYISCLEQFDGIEKANQLLMVVLYVSLKFASLEIISKTDAMLVGINGWEGE